jgi:hypothetical protein
LGAVSIAGTETWTGEGGGEAVTAAGGKGRQRRR